jgi:hypothetical protein
LVLAHGTLLRKPVVALERQHAKTVLQIKYGMFKKKYVVIQMIILVDAQHLKYGIALKNSVVPLQMLPVLDVLERVNGILYKWLAALPLIPPVNFV